MAQRNSAYVIHNVPGVVRATGRKPPKVIFHYTNIGAFENIVRTGELWATDLRYMNDAAELRHSTDLFSEQLHLTAAKSDERTKALDEFTGWVQILGEMENVYAVAFCEDGDSLSQWRSYSDYSGIAIGFDTEWLTERFDRLNFKILRCIYDEAEKLELVKEVVEKVWEVLRSRGTKIAHAHLVGYFIRLAPLLKHESFRGEKEWRLVSFPIPNSREGEDYRPGSTTMIPFYRLKLPAEDKEGFPLPQIILGPTGQPEVSKAATKRFLDHCGISVDEIAVSSSPLRLPL